MTTSPENNRARTADAIALVVVFAIVFALATMTVMSSVQPVPPPHYRIVRTDDGATKIPLPYRGSIILYPPELIEYLTVTRTPESVAAVAPVNKLYARSAPFFSRVYPAALAYPEIFGNSTFGAGNPEALLRLSPSAVILWSGFATSLERAGVPVVRIGHRMHDWTVNNAMIFAALLGLDQRRIDLQQSYEASLQRLHQDLKIDRFVRKPRVLWVTILPDASLVVPGEASPAGNIVAAAGGVMIPSRGGRLSPELVFKVAPDLIVWPFYPWLAGPNAIMTNHFGAPCRPVATTGSIGSQTSMRTLRRASSRRRSRLAGSPSFFIQSVFRIRCVRSSSRRIGESFERQLAIANWTRN